MSFGRNGVNTAFLEEIRFPGVRGAQHLAQAHTAELLRQWPGYSWFCSWLAQDALHGWFCLGVSWILLYMFVGVYLHSDPCVNTGMYAFRCMCVLMLQSQREISNVLSIWSGAHQVGWVTWLGSELVCLPSSGIANAYHQTQHLTWLLEIWLSSSCLQAA